MRYITLAIAFLIGTNAQAQIIRAEPFYTAPEAVSGNLLLDDYPGAAVAYSLRKLDKDYTGSAIRVRRSSDNTEQDIGFVNNYLDTASMKTFVGANNGFVVTWYNQADSAGVFGVRNATQTTAANQPQIISSGTILYSENKPCISFDGTNHILNIATSSLNSGAALYNIDVYSTTNAAASDVNTMISWCLGTAAASTNLFAKASSTGSLSGEKITFDVRRSVNGSERIASSTYARGASTLVVEILEVLSSGMSFYQDNSIVSLDLATSGASTSNNYTPNNSTYDQRLTLGGLIASPSTVVSAPIRIMEQVFYKTNQSSNRSAIFTNINSFYSIY